METGGKRRPLNERGELGAAVTIEFDRTGCLGERQQHVKYMIDSVRRQRQAGTGGHEGGCFSNLQFAFFKEGAGAEKTVGQRK